MTKDKKLEAALHQVRHFIESLRASSASANVQPLLNPPFARGGVVVFSYRRLDGLRLTGKEADNYRGCLDSLIALHGGNPNIRVMSYGAVEELFRKTILRVLRVRRPPGESRDKFERRLDRELRTLRKGLLAEPKEWRLSIPVHGLASAMLPLTFGGIEFVDGTEAAATSVTAPIVNFRPHPRRAETKVAREQELLTDDRRKILEIFKGQPISSVRVLAMDAGAAERRGLEHVRRVLDILTFYAGYFSLMKHRYRAFVAPDGKRTDLNWILCVVETGRCSWGWSSPTILSVSRIDLTSGRAKEIGLPRVNEMLCRPVPSDLEIRIITALGWAGRAHAEIRRDQAFLLLAVALEALLTKATSRAGVTERLCLRVAHLLGKDSQTRKEMYDTVHRLYRIRSVLVHTGDSTELEDGDLATLEAFVDSAVTTVLVEQPFAGMRTAGEFDKWLDDQLLN